MIRRRTKRRWGAGVLLISAVVVAAGIGQKEWSLQTLTAGKRTRGRLAGPAAQGGAPDRDGPTWTAMHKMGALSAEIQSEELRDSVAAGPALSAPGSAPKGITDAAVKEAAAAQTVSAKLGKKGRGKGGKGGGVEGLDGSADGPGGARAHGRGRGEGSRGGGGKGSSKKGASSSSAQTRGAGGHSSAVGGGRGGHSSRGRHGKDGSLVLDADGTGKTGATGSSGRGHGHHRGRGSDAQADDFFGSGNGKLKGAKGSSASSSHGGGGHGGKHKGGGHGGGGAGGGDDDAASDGGSKHGGGGKHGKGGGHKGGGGKKDHSGGGKGQNSGDGGDDDTSPYGERSPAPPDAVSAPDFKGLKGKVPAADSDGAPIAPKPAGYKDIEGINPPTGGPPDSGPAGFKWNKGPDGAPYYCQGTVCGRWANEHWVWLQNQDGKWFMQSYAPGADGSLSPDSPAYSRHQGHWWYQDANGQGQWSVIHNGVPWSYNYLVRWKQNGLTNPDTGAQMVYTPDGNVMVVRPGKGATIYDPATGKVVGRKKESELPAQPKDPNAPADPNDPPPPDSPFPILSE